MSIVRLTKVALFGNTVEQKATLNELQNLGCMHLISAHEELPPVELTPKKWEESAFEAQRHLLSAPRRRRQALDDEGFSLERVVEAALKNKQQLREVSDRRIALRNRISQLAPWGNFVLPPVEELGGHRLWFYRIPLNERTKVQSLELPWEVVSTDHRFVYVVVISKDEPPQHLLPVARTHAGEVPLGDLKRDLQRLDLQAEDLIAEQNALSRWINLLSTNLAQLEDQQALEQALRRNRQVDQIFVVQGWIPVLRIPELRTFAEAKGLALLQEEPGPEENPPTLMENPAAFQGGQDLVTFYETPGYHAWDPSAVTTFSFAVFFAMILSDAGYALVLAILIYLFRNKLGQSAGGRRFRLLMSGVLAVAFGYGVLAGSYFGIEPPRGSLLGDLHLINLHDLASMMQLSLIIGCAHLILANAVSSLHAQNLSNKLKPIGWIAVIVGGLLLYLAKGTMAQQAMRSVSVGFVVIGLLLLVCFGSDRRVNSFKTGLLRVFGGLATLFDITKIFGDTLSYMRLFALGLASASLAITFNHIAEQIRLGAPGLGLFLALLVLLFGHALNLLLGIISGFVHGLRLNYIEFFNWAISEEGHPFRAFRKKEIQT